MNSILNIHELKQALEQRKNALPHWKDYYEKQKIIKTITEKTEGQNNLKYFCERVTGTDLSQTEFIVLVPVTFFHLGDFINNVPSAATIFSFMKNGEVICQQNTGLGTITLSHVFFEIFKRVSGKDLEKVAPLVPKMEITNKETEEQLLEKSKQFQETITLWMEKFEKLPAVNKVSRYDEDTAGRLVTVEIKTNYPEEDCVDWYCLNIGNETECTGWTPEGEISEVFTKWEAGLTIKTWQDLYDALVELSKLYVELPQLKKETV